MKKKWMALIIVYVALILICAFAVYAVPSIRGLMIKTYIAEQGEIKLCDEVKVRLVRNEKTYKAVCDGKIEKLAKQGKLYKAGTKIIDFTDASGQAKTENCFSKKPGYVVYLSRRKKYASGDAIYRIVKNTKWHMKYDIEPEKAKKYYEGAVVRVEIGDENIKARVVSIKKKKDFTRIKLEFGVLFQGCLAEDTMDANVIVASATGLIVEDKSIVKKGKKRGVITKNKMGQYIFKPISVKADDGEKCVVYQDIYMDAKYNFIETISIYDEIVKNPTKEDIENSL